VRLAPKAPRGEEVSSGISEVTGDHRGGRASERWKNAPRRRWLTMKRVRGGQRWLKVGPTAPEDRGEHKACTNRRVMIEMRSSPENYGRRPKCRRWGKLQIHTTPVSSVKEVGTRCSRTATRSLLRDQMGGGGGGGSGHWRARWVAAMTDERKGAKLRVLLNRVERSVPLRGESSRPTVCSD
jgi:hypothetical protein